ncbi:hypothetical protein Tco_0231820 [Tanacetum coccineum]
METGCREMRCGGVVTGDHPSLASGPRVKTLDGFGADYAGRLSFVGPGNRQAASRSVLCGSSSTLSAPVDTAAATTTSTMAKLTTDVNPDLAGPSQPSGSEAVNVGVARKICLGSEVRSRAKHEESYFDSGGVSLMSPSTQKDNDIPCLTSRTTLILILLDDGILGHALGRAVDFGMQEGLEAGHEHGVARRSLSVVDAYNPEVVSVDYVNAVRALEDATSPWWDL